MSDYYKSLVSDDEVIKELLKESKRREGTLPTEATRLKPNLNFFQRTVNSLVSTNTRIDKSQDTFKTEYLKDCCLEKPASPSKKTQVDYAFERNMVLQTKIDFVKSSEAFNGQLTNNIINKKIHIKKISFVGKAAGVYPTKNRELGNIFSDDDNEERKRVAGKHFKSEFKGISKKSIGNDVICISSDDGSVEILSSDSDHKKIRNKVKHRTKKHEESGQKAKRKKHKKKKKK